MVARPGIGAISNAFVVTNGAEFGGDGKLEVEPMFTKYEPIFLTAGVVSTECLLI